MGNDREFFETIEEVTSDWWRNAKPFITFLFILFVLYLLLSNIKY
jgi:hypothetical protein